MMGIERAVADLNRREIRWMDIPEDIRKELTGMEQDIHEADGDGPIVMKWYRLILKNVNTTPPEMAGGPDRGGTGGGC